MIYLDNITTPQDVTITTPSHPSGTMSLKLYSTDRRKEYEMTAYARVFGMLYTTWRVSLPAGIEGEVLFVMEYQGVKVETLGHVGAIALDLEEYDNGIDYKTYNG